MPGCLSFLVFLWVIIQNFGFALFDRRAHSFSLPLITRDYTHIFIEPSYICCSVVYRFLPASTIVRFTLFSWTLSESHHVITNLRCPVIPHFPASVC